MQAVGTNFNILVKMQFGTHNLPNAVSRQTRF